MGHSYLLLAGLIACVIVGLMCLSLTVLFVEGLRETEYSTDPDELKRRKAWIIAAPIAGAVCIACFGTAGTIFRFLFLNSPQILQNFGIWYLFGFVCRLPLLYYKEFIFSPCFDIEWEEVFITFFWALLGPLQLAFTVHGVWKHKSWD